ncbi:MAG: U3 small nucleolar RNA-associated protein 14, partial [Bacillariaceae sp.]
DMMQNEEEEVVEKKRKALSDKEMKGVLQKGELVASSLEFGNSNSIATSNGIEIDLGNGEDDDDDDEQSETSSTKGTAKNDSGTSEYVAKMEFDKVSSNSTPSSDIKSNQKKGTSKASVTVTERVIVNDGEEANPWMKSTDGKDSKKDSRGVLAAKKAKRKGVIDVAGATDILDDGKEDTHDGENNETNNISDKDGKQEEKKISMLTQEELVRRAFVGENESQIDEDFKKEKELMAAEAADPTRKVGKEKINSDDVVGWGAWTGQGSLPPRPRKLPKKLQAPKRKKDEKRKFDSKPDVIINRKRLKKTANSYMLADVPHPYSSRAEYEQAMLGGVGKEWNVSSTYKNNTRPEILTRSGKIIQPISKKAKKARPAAKF